MDAPAPPCSNLDELDAARRPSAEALPAGDSHEVAHRSQEEVGASEEALAPPGACRDAAVAPASGKGDDQAVVGIPDKPVDEPAEEP